MIFELSPGAWAHDYQCRVYFADTDAGGVVYHANYLAMAESARTEALREAGVPHSELVSSHGVSFIVRRAEIEYLRPARLDDLLTIRTICVAAGGASATLKQIFLCADQPLARLTVRLGCVSVVDFRPARLPPKWRAAMMMVPPDPG